MNTDDNIYTRIAKEKKANIKFTLQTILDTLSFRHGLATWCIDNAALKNKWPIIPIAEDLEEKSSDLFLQYVNEICNHPKNIIPSFESEASRIAWSDFLLSEKNKFAQTVPSYQDPFYLLLKEAPFWKAWLILWKFNLAHQCIASQQPTFGKIFAPDSKSPTDPHLDFSAYPVKNLDATLIVGPVLNVGDGPIDHAYSTDAAEKLAAGFHKFSSEKANHLQKLGVGLQAVYAERRIQRKMSLRSPLTTSTFKKQSAKLADSLQHILTVKVSEYLTAHKIIFTEPLIGIVGGVEYYRDIKELMPSDNELIDSTLYYKILSLRTNDNRPTGKNCWLRCNRNGYSLCSLESPPKISSGYSKRIFLSKSNGDRILPGAGTKHEKTIEMLDDRLVYLHNRTVGRRNSYMHEQFRLARNKLTDRFGEWIVPVEQQEDEIPKSFKEALEQISLVCFRLFRADKVSLYQYSDAKDSLIPIGTLHNRTNCLGLTTIPLSSGSSEMTDIAKKDRKSSIAYRCIDIAKRRPPFAKDPLRSYRIKGLWVRNYNENEKDPRYQLRLTDAYLEGAIPRSELAVDLTIFDKVWGVLTITGYRAQQFDSSSHQDADALARIFALAIYDCWVQSELAGLSRYALLRKQHSTDDIYSRICEVLCDIFMIESATLWVERGAATEAFECRGQHNFTFKNPRDESEYLIAYKKQMQTHGNSCQGTVMYRAITSEPGDRPYVFDEISADSVLDKRFLSHLNAHNLKLKWIYALPLRDADGAVHEVLCFYTAYKFTGWDDYIRSVIRSISTLVAALRVRESERDLALIKAEHTIDRELESAEGQVDRFVAHMEKVKNFDTYAKQLITDVHDEIVSIQRHFEEIYERGDGLPERLRRREVKSAIPLRKTFNTFVQPILKNAETRYYLVRQEIPPTLHLLLPEELLREILVNLADNAVKYREPGSPIMINYVEHSRSHIIEFRNMGEPLNPYEADLIWLPRERSKAAKKQDIKGKGIGLYMVRELCKEWDCDCDYDPIPLHLDSSDFSLHPVESGESDVIDTVHLIELGRQNLQKIREQEEETLKKKGKPKLVWHQFRIIIPKVLYGDPLK